MGLFSPRAVPLCDNGIVPESGNIWNIQFTSNLALPNGEDTIRVACVHATLVIAKMLNADELESPEG